MRQPPFRQVTIVGLGLIGGSLGMALRKGRIARRVIGFSRHEATIRRAKARRAVDDACTELCPDWLGESDLVVIATLPLTVVPIARQIVKLTRHRFILTDVASTKGEISRALGSFLPGRITYVGSHPMAGSERSGIQAAQSNLFENAPCIVTPTAQSSAAAVGRVCALWKSVGGRVVKLSPLQHDRWVAQVSHVPHLAAVGLASTVEPQALALSAGGFADTTRVALGDPELWKEICLSNRAELISALGRFIKKLEDLRRKIRRQAERPLLRDLLAAQRIRRKV